MGKNFRLLFNKLLAHLFVFFSLLFHSFSQYFLIFFLSIYKPQLYKQMILKSNFHHTGLKEKGLRLWAIGWSNERSRLKVGD
ncbi:hypothetical protein HanIR_Chr13g0669971 [Helianthus annuus]|nr:hypothetical protein HanIR_Chr13g0669971 [Helianthus annuus]